MLDVIARSGGGWERVEGRACPEPAEWMAIWGGGTPAIRGRGPADSASSAPSALKTGRANENLRALRVLRVETGAGDGGSRSRCGEYTKVIPVN